MAISRDAGGVGLAKPTTMIVGGLGLLAAIFIGMRSGRGDFLVPVMLIGGFLSVFILSVLGKKAWLLVPAAMMIPIPALPFMRYRAFDTTELVVMLVAVFFFVRVAMGQEQLVLFRKNQMGLILYISWAGIIFMMNPAGMLILRSTAVGGRMYFKLLVAFLSFLIIRGQWVDEKRAKLLIRLLLIGSFTYLTRALIGVHRADDFGFVGDVGSYYTWHQQLAWPALMITYWMLSRYRIDQLISVGKWHLLSIWAAAIAFGLASGKRSGFAGIIMAPVFVAMLRRNFRFAFLYGLSGLALITILVAGHGRIFELPRVAQRALANVPGARWDKPVMDLALSRGGDSFRYDIRQIAYEYIGQNPVFGKKGFALDLKEASFLYARGDEMTLVSMAGGWHNTWLAMAADFGIPAAIFWAIFWWQFWRLGWWIFQNTAHGTYTHTLVTMMLISFLVEVSRSWFGGHAALTPLEFFWQYGLLLAMQRGVLAQHAKAEAGAEGALNPVTAPQIAG